MSAKERQQLRSKGIFTVTQFSYTFRPRRRPKRLRDKREKYHHSLKALAIREQKIHIVGSPELKIEGTPVYLDVEGLPDRDFYYLIGLRIGCGKMNGNLEGWSTLTLPCGANDNRPHAKNSIIPVAIRIDLNNKSGWNQFHETRNASNQGPRVSCGLLAHDTRGDRSVQCGRPATRPQFLAPALLGAVY